MPERKHERLMLRGEAMDFPLVEHMGTNFYNHAVPLEYHQHWGYEFVFVIDGELSYEVEGGDSITIRGGQFSLMAPDIRHRAQGGFEAPCLSSWVVFNPKIRRGKTNTPFEKNDLKDIGKALQGRETSVQSFRTKTRHTLRRFRVALTEHFSKAPPVASLAMLRSIACELIVDGAHQIQSDRPKAEENYGESATAFIERNLFEKLSVPAIAAHLGFSVSRTYELFREHTGQSPIDYVLRLRIKAAENMLRDEGSNVSDVAFACGFNSSQYFARLFRKYKGVSPSAFRQRRN